MDVEVWVARHSSCCCDRLPGLRRLRRCAEENAVVLQVVYFLVQGPVEGDDTAGVVLAPPVLGEILHWCLGAGALRLLWSQAQIRFSKQGPVRTRQIGVDDDEIGFSELSALQLDACGSSVLHDHLVHSGLCHHLHAVILGQGLQGVLDAPPPPHGVPDAIGQVCAGQKAEGARGVVGCQAHVKRLESEESSQPVVIEESLHKVIHRAEHVQEG
mmetsp:Transcript_55892/g.120926  ORF Transcript_55892/g.120926 Transcript_55892/m.120926 type:complete len:214 (-) Transcript_55892:913-1554(-)